MEQPKYCPYLSFLNGMFMCVRHPLDDPTPCFWEIDNNGDPKDYADCDIYKEEKGMENKSINLEKVLDVANSGMKLAANLSEGKKEKTPTPPNDNSNSATSGNQNVQIHMDTGKKNTKPVEKHIHEFPESRSLTTEECELALKKAQMEYELEKSKQDHIVEVDNRTWEHQLEVERRNERKSTFRGIIACIFGAGGIGAVGYSIWRDLRSDKAARTNNAIPAQTTAKAEGEVK